MPDAFLVPLLLFVTGLVAGTLNVIAGGGSMLTLPVMIFLGLPPTLANGTNRVAILMQNVGATWGFHRKGLVDYRWLKLAVPPALVGGVVGTWAAMEVGDRAFQQILALVLLGAAAWTIWHPMRPPDMGGTGPPERALPRLGFALAFAGIGLFGGFIQAGVGFLILAATTVGGLDLVRGNALKIPLVLTFTSLALVLFAVGGLVDWAVGLSLGVGNLIGGQIGVHLAVLKGHAWIRKVVTATLVVFAVRLLWPA